MDSSRHLNFPVGYHPSVLRWAFLRRYGLSQGNPSTLARAIASASHHLGTLELSGIDHTINAARLRAIRESSSRYLTPKLPLVLDEQWSGLRPCTPDGLPVISVVPALRNLIVASGHAMLGVSLGPVTGKLAAQLACGEPADLDVSSLKISRFG